MVTGAKRRKQPLAASAKQPATIRSEEATSTMRLAELLSEAISKTTRVQAAPDRLAISAELPALRIREQPDGHG